MKLTKKQARQFVLAHQGLLQPRRLKGKSDIIKFIKRVGCIQFDPLDKVGYNPHLVIQSRVNNYKADFLRELLYTERKLIDGWDKNMSIYSVDDWPYFSRHREQAYQQHKNKSKLIEEVIPEVRDIIDKKGPSSSIDLDFDTKIDWPWAPTRAARAALEAMHSWGELIIHHKVGTRKVYDFTAKHLPANLLETSDPNQAQEDYYSWYVKRRIGSVGMLWSLSGGAWLGIDGLKKRERTRALAQLEDQDEIIEVKVEDIRHSFYVRREELDLLQEVVNGINFKPEISFIAPLDNLLWDRKLIKRIFDFEYVWEVYKPSSERKYGYYVLPVLYGDKFVGRFEPVFDKETQELIIKNWWWEDKVDINQKLKNALINCFKQFANCLGADSIKLKTNKKILQELSLSKLKIE